MFARLLPARLNYANVVSTLALFAALGGTSMAAIHLGRNAVAGSNIAPNAVTSPKVKDGSLLSKDFKAGQLPAGQKGDRGDTGPAGPAGATGPAGSDAQFNGAAAGGALTGSYPNPSLGDPEDWHDIGTSGEPAFGPGGATSTAAGRLPATTRIARVSCTSADS